ncbi:DnaD domain protein [Desulfitobacterium hafniense]|uniref:DnaD domain protein n=1 Tax=Desulfitobacterium hafniense TaxID=49338 RepID=UPI00036F4DC3|nr:DnaD domain protein [Desulfitobacterium hafniense]
MTEQISLYDLLNRFDAFGGVERVSQSGFCLWYALIRKSNKLGWAGTFSMTNAELIYTGGFSSEKALWQARNKLIQMGLIEYEAPPRGKTLPGRYKINFCFEKIELIADDSQEIAPPNSEVIPKCFQIENSSEAVRESLWKQFGIRSETLIRIDKINDNDHDDMARIFSEILAGEFSRPILPAETKQVRAILERLFEFAPEHTVELLKEAVSRCTVRGITKVTYLSSILANWEKCNLKSLAEIMAYERNKQARPMNSRGKRVGESKGQSKVAKVEEGKYKDFYLS